MNRYVVALILISSFSQLAVAKLCENLFKHGQEPLQILILPKSQTKDVFQTLKLEAIDEARFYSVYLTLVELKEEGLTALSQEQIKILIQFRQDISFLRSSYELLSDDHKSPKKFDAFVKAFGKLKDLILMEDAVNAQDMATVVLQNFEIEQFKKLVVDKELASKKSIKTYVKSTLLETERLLHKKITSVDQVHTIRKSLRNIYRYLEIQKDVLEMSASELENFKYQLKYLKKINEELGQICDQNAMLILSGHIKKDYPYVIPYRIHLQIDYFLKKYNIAYAHKGLFKETP